MSAGELMDHSMGKLEPLVLGCSDIAVEVSVATTPI